MRSIQSVLSKHVSPKPQLTAVREVEAILERLGGTVVDNISLVADIHIVKSVKIQLRVHEQDFEAARPILRFVK